MTAAVDLKDVDFVGADIKRPECILTTADGTVYAADARGAFTRIAPDGKQTLFGEGLTCRNAPLMPNGFDLHPDGSALIAQLDDAEGGVWRLAPDGSFSPFLLEADGIELPPTNFVHVDDAARVWVTVSTRQVPRYQARRPDCTDGLLVLVQDGTARIVADDLVFTNEAKVDPSGEWLYVNETFARRLIRFPLKANGELGPRETVTEFGKWIYPDGLTFDEEGAVWIVSAISNRILRVLSDGTIELMLEDSNGPVLDEIEGAYQSGEMGRTPGGRAVPSEKLGNITSIAFGGPDRKTAYVGCLKDTHIARFRSPIAGARPSHWSRSFG